MPVSSTLLNHLSLEKQCEIIEQLIIHDNDLEHAFEIINITGPNIISKKNDSTDLIDYLFQKTVHKICYFLTSIDSFDTIEIIQDIFPNDYNDFVSLLKFVYIIPDLSNKLNSYILSLLITYYNDHKDYLFQNNNNNDIDIIKILDSLSKNNTTIDVTVTINPPNPLDEKQIVVLLKLLETIYIQSNDTLYGTITSNYKSTSLIDRCLLIFLGCDIESIATQCSKLMRWRQDTIIQDMYLSKFDIDDWICSYLISTCLNKNECNWKLKIFLTFLLRSLNYSNLPSRLIEFFRSDGFIIFLQSSLDHDLIEYRKISLSLLKLFIIKFKWDPTNWSKIKISWDRFIRLYETIALDSQLNTIKSFKTEITNFFNDQFIDGSWGLILFSTGFKSDSMEIKQYMVSLVFEIKNKNNFFYSNLSLTQSILLPALIDNPLYFKTLCVGSNDIQSNVCPHGDSISNLFYEILKVSKDDQRLTMIETMFNVMIDTNFVPAKIYGIHGIHRYLKATNIPILNNKHLILIKKLFVNSKCETVVWNITIKSLLFKMSDYIDHKYVTLIEWLDFLTFCIKQYFNDNKNSDHMDIGEPLNFEIEIDTIDKWCQDKENVLQNHLGFDFMFDALCIILFNVEVKDPDMKLLATISRLMKVFPKLNKNFHLHKLNDSVTTSLIQLGTSEMLNDVEVDHLYCYAYDIIIYNDTLTTINKLINPHSLFDHILTSFSPNKLKFIVSLCERYDANLSLDFDKFERLYLSIIKFIDTQNLDNIDKDRIYGDFFKLIRLNMVSKNCDFDFYDKILTTIITDKNVCNGVNRHYRDIEILEICSLIFNATIISENLQIQSKCFKISCTIWENYGNYMALTSKRKFLSCFIRCIFTSNNIFVAVSDPLSLQRQNLEKYIKQLCCIGSAQRGVLPILSQQFELFFKKYNFSLNTSITDTWLSSMLISIFVQELTEKNNYHLESVVSYLYDKTFLAMNNSYISLYKRVYGAPEIFSQVSIIVGLIFSGSPFQINFINYLIRQNDVLNGDKYNERGRVLKWQLILVNLYASGKKQLIPEIENVMKSVLFSLESENSMETRIYKEWFIAYCLSILYKDDTNPFDFETILFDQLGDHSKPLLVVSVERILFLVLKAQTRNVSKQLLSRFLFAVVSNATSNKPLVRHFTNSLITLFWPIFMEQLQLHPMKDILENIFNNAKGNPKSTGKIRTGDAKVWDLYEDLTLSGIFGNVAMQILGEGQHRIASHLFREYDNLVDKFKDLFPIGEVEDSNLLTTLNGYSNTWMDNPGLKNIKRSELIVVASLVDKPFNLGGICRLCDVLGVKTVTVQDLRVKDSSQFKDVSLCSEKWMSMEEVPLDSIARYMQEKKAQGYTLIGLEQTDKSIRLDDNYKFPSKSLILLGTEAYGIPGPLLKELDLCLEIQQHGVIRSMNIQTATAVIVHSYTIQHL